MSDFILKMDKGNTLKLQYKQYSQISVTPSNGKEGGLTLQLPGFDSWVRRVGVSSLVLADIYVQLIVRNGSLSSDTIIDSFVTFFSFNFI